MCIYQYSALFCCNSTVYFQNLQFLCSVWFWPLHILHIIFILICLIVLWQSLTGVEQYVSHEDELSLTCLRQQELMVADWALIWELGYDWGLRKALYMITWLRKKESKRGMHKSRMISIWSSVKRDFFPPGETDSLRIGWYGLNTCIFHSIYFFNQKYWKKQ